MGVYGKVEPPLMVLQPKAPPVQVRALEPLAQETKPAPLREAVKRLVEDAVVAKELVVVALVPVAVVKLNRCRVVEPETRRSPEVLIEVEAVLPIARVLALRALPKRLVVVAEVEVLLVMLLKMFAPVKVLASLKSVVEAVLSVLVTQEKAPPVQRRAWLPAVQVLRLAPKKLVAKRLVLDAVVEKKLVEVA